MLRRLFTAASALSLLLCVAALAFWARSDERRDEAPFRWRGITYALASDRGRVGIDNRPQQQEFLDARKRAFAEVANARMAYSGQGTGAYDPYVANMIQATNRMDALLATRPPAPVRFAIPYWAILVAALALPIAWGSRWHKRALRVAGHRCAECNYDLRGSTGRCPECGTAISSKG